MVSMACLLYDSFIRRTGCPPEPDWEQQGKAWVLHPSQPIEIGRLERRSDRLQAVYDLGTGDAEASLGSLRTYLAQG